MLAIDRRTGGLVDFDQTVTVLGQNLAHKIIGCIPGQPRDRHSGHGIGIIGCRIAKPVQKRRRSGQQDPQQGPVLAPDPRQSVKDKQRVIFERVGIVDDQDRAFARAVMIKQKQPHGGFECVRLIIADRKRHRLQDFGHQRPGIDRVGRHGENRKIGTGLLLKFRNERGFAHPFGGGHHNQRVFAGHGVLKRLQRFQGPFRPYDGSAVSLRRFTGSRTIVVTHIHIRSRYHFPSPIRKTRAESAERTTLAIHFTANRRNWKAFAPHVCSCCHVGILVGIGDITWGLQTDAAKSLDRIIARIDVCVGRRRGCAVPDR